ncbi:MAG: HamA C-terminal domain-containing protein [Sedimentisphaerales bacterium]
MRKTFTTYNGKSVVFDVVVDETLHALALQGVIPNKKALFSLVNDFEGGMWRKSQFCKFILDNIKETALSEIERNALIGNEYSSLAKSAGNVVLTDDNEDDKGGEIGEILLYGILKHYYSALPVVPKIFYKQNTRDYAKGADSVHIVLEADNSFSIWLGEAKFYNSLDNSRFDKILKSVESMLDNSKLRKELNIVTSMKDLELLIHDQHVFEEIKRALADGISLDAIKTKLHIPILLLHECNITKLNNDSMGTYKKKIKDYHLTIAEQFLKKQESKLNSIYGYSDICFHLILFPVPDKTELVRIFRKKIIALRED